MESEEEQLTRKLPDSVTTWFISGFALHPQHGLGFSATKKLNAVKEFFVEVEMPRKMIYGEIAKVDVFLHKNTENFHQVNTNVQLTVNHGEFEIVEVMENCRVKKLSEKNQRKSVKVTSAAIVSFFVRPVTTGDFKVIIKATSQAGTDKVEHSVAVKHESASHYVTRTVLADVRSKKFYSFYSTLNQDDEAIVPGSSRVGVTACGNIMGSPIKVKGQIVDLFKYLWNLHSLIYLRSVGILTDEKKAKLLEDLLVGYQDLIKKREPNKSFGTLWMTALAAKSLAYTKNWIEIDPQITVSALNFLDKKQENSGDFKEINETSSIDMALTAFVTIAFLENENYKTRFDGTIADSIRFIENNHKQIQNNFDLALATYALVLNKKLHNYPILDQLNRNAIVQGDEMHWELEFIQNRGRGSENIRKKIEIASYALLANLKANKLDESKKILKWLITNKQNFNSVANAVVLQALTEAAKTFNSNNFELDIYLVDDDEVRKHIRIHDGNQLVPLAVELSPWTKGISINANGSGIAVVEMWWKFNLKTDKISKHFDVNVEINPKSSYRAINFKVCANRIPKSGERLVSELAVMEVSLPSGFVFSDETNNYLKSSDLKGFESRENNSVVLIYVENLGTEPICFDFEGLMKNEIKHLKKASVKVYDFQQKGEFGLVYYGHQNQTCSL